MRERLIVCVLLITLRNAQDSRVLTERAPESVFTPCMKSGVYLSGWYH
jgi:hypothetical protein